MVWTFIKTTLLIGFLTGILFVIAYLLGLSPLLALGFAAFMNIIIYWFSDKFVLRMGGAHFVTEQEAPRVYSALSRLTAETGNPMPKVALVNSPIPNAVRNRPQPQQRHRCCSHQPPEHRERRRTGGCSRTRIDPC